MQKRGKGNLAEPIKGLLPADIERLGIAADKLQDAKHYDGIILKILQDKHPQLNATAADVAWDYNFYKNKLNEAFKVGEAGNFKKVTPAPVVSPGESGGIPQEILPAKSEDILLDVDNYVAERTTRGVFWEASKNNRMVELHVGSAADFKDHIAQRGAKIIGEVKTKARNYNPIYLVQDPGKDTFHYAITELSGNDRVRHFAAQSSLVRWQHKAGELAPPPPVHVIGDAAAKLAAEEAQLTQVLKVIPKADRVILGQKGAFEKAIGSLGKTQAILALYEKNPDALKAVITDKQIKLLDKAKGAGDDLATFVMKNGSDLEKIYKASQPLYVPNGLTGAPDFKAYTYDRGSYEMSDYILADKNGNPQRWRVVSNVWGDEVLPVAKALKATEHNNVVYIGTAGALPNSKLKVGDLVIPENAYAIDGVKRPIRGDLTPEGAKRVDTVAHVSTPFEEDHEWLKGRNKFAQVVEIETGYLSSVFNDPKDRVHTMLLVSDLVGVEGETLAHANSSVRRRAQINAMTSVMKDSKVVGPTSAVVKAPPAGVASWINELLPSRDEVSKFQLRRKAEIQGLQTKDQVEALIKSEKSFNTAKLETSLREADRRFFFLLEEASQSGLLPNVAATEDFLNGRWNPAAGPVKLHLEVASPEAKLALEELLKQHTSKDKNFKKFLDVSIGNSTPAEFVKMAGFLDRADASITALYKDVALGFGGLAPTESRTGSLKFVQVAPPQSGHAITSTAHFTPDEKTKTLLQGLTGNADSNMELFREFTSDAFEGRNFEVKIEKVAQIDGGVMAKIVPDISSDEKLVVKLLITEEGLKNKAVVAEEAIHLMQITHPRPEFDWSELPSMRSKLAAFNHPYEWAETVANARAGSPLARENLARLEVEAQHALKDYAEMAHEGNYFHADDLAKIEEYQKARLAHAEKIYLGVSKDAKKKLKEREQAFAQMKERFNELEKADKKFDDYVKANDRAKVKELLDTYLPWDVMEPSEKHAWRKWVDAIVDVDPDNKMVVFRGLNEDVLQRGNPKGPGIFSSILSKNQGNYTRRLRSLTTMRERFGSNDFKVSPYGDPKAKSAPSLLTMMHNHANDPKGSPFLSTSNHGVASGFGQNSRVALSIDKKRLVTNAMAFKFLGEREVLVPLVTFPDEVVYFEEHKSKNDNFWESRINDEEFLAKVEEKLGRPLTEFEKSGTGWGNNDDFIKDGYRDIRALMLDAEKLPTQGACLVTTGASGLAGCNCVYSALENLLK